MDSKVEMTWIQVDNKIATSVLTLKEDRVRKVSSACLHLRNTKLASDSHSFGRLLCCRRIGGGH